MSTRDSCVVNIKLEGFDFCIVASESCFGLEVMHFLGGLLCY
jgi:hypothetical protein